MFKVGQILVPVRKNMYNKDIRRLVIESTKKKILLEVLDDSSFKAHGIKIGYRYELNEDYIKDFEKDYTVEFIHNDILKDLCSK